MHLGFGSLRLTLRFQVIRSLEAKGKVLGGIGLEVLVLGFLKCGGLVLPGFGVLWLLGLMS